MQLRAHEAQLNESEPVTQKILRIFGGSILLLAALLATVGASKTISNDWQKKYREITLMVILSLITLLFSKLLVFWAGRTGIIDPSSISFLLPQALAPLLVTILIGPRYGIICGIWVSIATGILFELSFGIFMLGFLVTIIGARMGCRVKNNSSVFRAEALVMLTKMLFVIIQGILLHPNIQVIFNQLAATGISVVVSTCFIILTIPLFETAFKFTSNIRLLELSDMTHPLLQRLAIEAPGTYHHSLMVSNVASQAAEKIGANFLLVRVAAYFHDIGKMVKPGFFTENIQYRDNPHDELTPSMSTLVIMSHVKEGVELARRYRLPEQIISAIRDHHGTGLVSYFYHRAKVQAEENGTTVNKDDFRYPGPLPVSKEMAILMLADSVEAASRSLEKPTPNKITTLVNEIVDAKIKDGQLDNSLLTMAQLTEIKQSFIFTLTNMLHGRVAYPKDGNNDSKPAK